MRKRQVAFAWGPAGGGEPGRIGAIEIGLTARAGGKVTLVVEGLRIEEVPPPPAVWPRPVVTASSSAAGSGGADCLFSEPPVPWRSGPGYEASLLVDLGTPREYGGLVLDWGDDFAREYEVTVSDDGKEWRTLRRVVSGDGGRDRIALPEAESRFLSLRLRRSARGAGYELRRLSLEPLAFSATPSAFLERVAADSPRGRYPRAFLRQAAPWAVVGVDGGREEGLLGADGALEAGKGAFSVEPFLLDGGHLVTWADVEAEATLLEGDLPVPSVTWRKGDLSLTITAFADGTPERSLLWARYRVRNAAAAPRRVSLLLALRPFQVNPSWQFLNSPGGVAEIRKLSWDGRTARVNGEREVVPLTAPSAFGAVSFDGGDAVDLAERGILRALPTSPTVAGLDDPTGLASAAFRWELDLAGGGEREVALVLPLVREGEEGTAPDAARQLGAPLAGPAAMRLVEERLAAVARGWRERLGRVAFEGPPAMQAMVSALRSTLGWILVNRDGPAIQPGSRSYERSWIRDGSLTSSALLRLGHADEARAFAEWFATFVPGSGRVPCCVDARGADAVPEHDSHGELLFLVADVYRHTRDGAFLDRMWPRVVKTAAAIEALTEERRTEAYEAPGKRAFFGLLPESISHEGYSARPVHSYWDDFWALKGLKDAAWLARETRRPEAARLEALRDRFARDLHASLRLVIAERKLAYVPGSVELADFDPTSTTVALSPGGEESRLPADALLGTFERYWTEFMARRDGTREWEAYTPYELRTVGAFVRLGRRDRAQEALRFFLRARWPAGWNQWPEVVWKDPSVSKFVGDLPHTWCGSDYVRSFLDLFAWEREADEALVLAAGLPRDWLGGGTGVAVKGLSTAYGRLDLSLREARGSIRVTVGGSLRVPPGGLVLWLPLDTAPSSVTVNGRPLSPVARDEIVVRDFPAEVEVRP